MPPPPCPPDRHVDRRPAAAMQGFTLVELLVVLAILVALSAVAVPQVIRYLDRARVDTARVEIENIGATLDLFRLDVGRYPTEAEGLQALVAAPAAATGWAGPYLRKADMVRDPWDRPYRYRQPGRHGTYDLYTLGADDAEGGEGADQDVTSW